VSLVISENDVQIKIGVQDIVAVVFGCVFLLVSLSTHYSGKINYGYLVFHAIFSGTLIFSVFDDKPTQINKILITIVYLSLFWAFQNQIALEEISIVIDALLLLLDTNIFVMILFGILIGLSSLVLFLYDSKIANFCTIIIIVYSVVSSLFSVPLIIAPNSGLSARIFVFFQCYLFTYVTFSFFNSFLLITSHLIHSRFKRSNNIKEGF
jgi:hypothetical protein